MISIKEMDEGDGLTLSTDTLSQRFLIRSKRCKSSSGSTRDLREPMPLETL